MAAISGRFKHLNIWEMVIKILGDKGTPAYEAAEKVVKSLRHVVWDPTYLHLDLAIAPLLTKKLSDEEICEPMMGVLIFHPSPLPYGRGASAIRWAYRRKEPITAATWFWADSGYDNGPICEQEIIKIDYNKRPRDFYAEDVIPAMERTLIRALFNLECGYKRAIPQAERYATYDPKL